MIESNDTIQIWCAENGFVVRLAHVEEGLMLSAGDMRVFQSMAELTNFIQHHFTHRAGHLMTDACGRLDD